MKVTLASTYGFCQGVQRAVDIALFTRETNPETPIYLLNKIVHNQMVTDILSNHQITTLDDDRPLLDKLKSIKDGIVVFSAHGHAPILDEIAKENNLKTIDAACPLVKLNTKHIIDSLNNEIKVFYIGIKDHPETTAILSLSKEIFFIDFKNPMIPPLTTDEKVSVHNQTTLIEDELDTIYNQIKEKCNNVKIYNDICHATSARQKALQEVSDEDIIIIIGDKISSNSTRLYEIAKKNYPLKAVYFVSNLEEVKNLDIKHFSSAFISAGASTPKQVIDPIVNYIKNL